MNPQNVQPSPLPGQSQPVVGGPSPPTPNQGDLTAGQTVVPQATTPDVGANQSVPDLSQAQFTRAETIQPNTSQALSSKAVFSNPSAQNASSNASPLKRSRKGLVFVVVIMIVLLVGGISAALLNRKGLDDVDKPSANQSSFDKDYADRQREVDIEAMRQGLEVHYVQNGVYPLFSQMNDENWVTTNMPDLEADAFSDPAGSSSRLSETPAVHVYSYQPNGCNDEFCTAFTVTATLNDGMTFSRTSRGDNIE